MEQFPGQRRKRTRDQDLDLLQLAGLYPTSGSTGHVSLSFKNGTSQNSTVLGPYLGISKFVCRNKIIVKKGATFGAKYLTKFTLPGVKKHKKMNLASAVLQ